MKGEVEYPALVNVKVDLKSRDVVSVGIGTALDEDEPGWRGQSDSRKLD